MEVLQSVPTLPLLVTIEEWHHDTHCLLGLCVPRGSNISLYSSVKVLSASTSMAVLEFVSAVAKATSIPRRIFHTQAVNETSFFPLGCEDSSAGVYLDVIERDVHPGNAIQNVGVLARCSEKLLDQASSFTARRTLFRRIRSRSKSYRAASSGRKSRRRISENCGGVMSTQGGPPGPSYTA